MNPEDNYAANFARKMTLNTSGEYANLSALMCWDAIKYCALKSGIVSQKKYDALQGKFDLVSSTDRMVVGKNAMYRLPPGYVLGFFWKNGQSIEIIHAMLSLGLGKAAGNKNDCVGAGHSVGWEMLDLSNDLNWNEDGSIHAPGGGVNGRTLIMCKRPISYLKNK